jgi:putative FmdB family regulatory protein
VPTYEFACLDCGAHADVRASLAEKDAGLEPVCAACGSARMRRLLSAFATVGAGAPQPAAGGGAGCCGGGCCSA